MLATFKIDAAKDADTWKTLVDVNEDVLAGVKLGDMEELWYTSKDGLKVQGWLIKPANFQPGKKYPMVLWIHGGPWSMYDVGFNWSFQNFAASGYAVLYTNPRGSTGYGQEFVNGIQHSYPGKDYDDLMAGVDAAIAKGFIDERNLFVCGGSGGGVLTAWIVGHTNRFAAAVSMRPVINWHSFVGTTDGPNWYRQFKKYPWEDPMEYAVRSPLNYVAQRHDADDGDDRRGGSADADGPERGVLPGAQDAEEGDAAGAHAGGVPRLAPAVAPAAAAALSDGVVRQVQAIRNDADPSGSIKWRPASAGPRAYSQDDATATTFRNVVTVVSVPAGRVILE